MMADPVKRVARFDFWLNPTFDDRLARERDIAVDVMRIQGQPEEAWAVLERAHVYVVNAARQELLAAFRPEAPLLARCKNLLVASSAGAGYDTVDVEACTRAGVAVVNQAGGNAVSVAEMTIGLLLAVSRRIVVSHRKLQTERGFPREELMGHEIAGRTIGLVGIGHIGTRVAALARAFSMRVLACDPLLSAEEITRRGAEPVDLATLLANADVVSVHCPRDATTRHLFNATTFAAMRPGALFLNTARGGIHDETALAAALESGHLGGAGLDVWDPEPPPLDHPLLHRADVVATFHTAGVTHEARRNIAAINAEQIVGLFRGQRPPRLINPEVWPRFCERYEAILGSLPAGWRD